VRSLNPRGAGALNVLRGHSGTLAQTSGLSPDPRVPHLPPPVPDPSAGAPIAHDMLRASGRLAIGVAKIPRLARMDETADDHAVDLLCVLTRSATGAPHVPPGTQQGQAATDPTDDDPRTEDPDR
jgi:hypothetical protein